MIYSNGDFSSINWGKAAVSGRIGVVFGLVGGSGAQNSKQLSQKLVKNNKFTSQLARLLKASDDYAAGVISKRGMQGVFNLYGNNFKKTYNDCLLKIVPRELFKNWGKLLGLTYGATELQKYL